MKLGLSTITFRGIPLEKALKMVKKLGFDYVDIAGIPGWAPHLDFPSMTDADVQSLLETLERLKLKVASFNVGANIASLTDSEKSVKFIQSAIRVASKVSVPIITAGVGFRGGDRGLSVRNIKKLIKFGEENGVMFTLELPHLGTLAEKWKDALFYLSEVPEALITLDTSHFHISGGTLRDLEPFVDRIKHIHLRDAKGSEISYIPGEGEFDFEGFFKVVKSKYSGVYVLELEVHEASIDVLTKNVEASKKYVTKVFSVV